MKRNLFLSIFFLGVSPSWALHSPQTKEELDKLAAITSLMAKEKSEYPVKLEAANILIRATEGKVDSDDSDKIAARAPLIQARDAIIAAHAAVMTAIVQRTVKLYDIQPRLPKYPEDGRSIVTGPFSGTPRPAWSPVYVPENQPHKMKINGKDVPFPQNPEAAGMTWADGSVEFNDKAFRYSPGYLAALIFHESVHFEQITTRGRGDSITAVRAEMEAHSADCGPEAVAAFGLTAAEKAATHYSFMRQMEIFQRNPTADMTNSQFVAPGPADDGTAAFWGSAQSGAALEREARANNAADSARQIANREAKILHDQEDVDARRAAKQEAERRVYNYIMEAVALDCMNPQLYRYQIDSGASVNVVIDADALAGLLNEDMRRDGSKSWGNRPNSCQETLMRRIIAAQSPITTRGVVQWALDYRQAHPSLLRKFTASIGDFVGALNNLSISSGGSSGGGYSSGENRNGGPSRSPSSNNDGSFQRSIDAQNKELSKYDAIVHKVYYGDGNPNWDARRPH